MGNLSTKLTSKLSLSLIKEKIFYKVHELLKRRKMFGMLKDKFLIVFGAANVVQNTLGKYLPKYLCRYFENVFYYAKVYK